MHSTHSFYVKINRFWMYCVVLPLFKKRIFWRMNSSPIGFRKISVASLEWDFSVRFQEFNIFPKKDGDHEVHVRREKKFNFLGVLCVDVHGWICIKNVLRIGRSDANAEYSSRVVSPKLLLSVSLTQPILRVLGGIRFVTESECDYLNLDNIRFLY